MKLKSDKIIIILLAVMIILQIFLIVKLKDFAKDLSTAQGIEAPTNQYF